MEHKDFLNVYDQLSEINQESSQADYETVLRSVVKQLYKLSEQEFLSYYNTDIIKANAASIWILPDGRLLEMEFHQSLTEYILEKLFNTYCEEHGYYFKKTLKDLVQDFDARLFNDYLIKKFNWLKFNTGKFIDICYAIIPDEVTNKQLNILEDLMSGRLNLEDNILTIVDYNSMSDYKYKHYSLTKYTPADIIKRVKKYKISGVLEEAKKKG